MLLAKINMYIHESVSYLRSQARVFFLLTIISDADVNEKDVDEGVSG